MAEAKDKKTTTKKAPAKASTAAKPAKTAATPAADAAPKVEEPKPVAAATPEAAAGAVEAADAPKIRRKKGARHVPEGRAYIQATYNNTIITITDPEGRVLTWTSAGAAGFKGTRKATPYAASVAAENVTRNAKNYGMERIHVVISGVGSGREQAVRSLQANGLNVLTVADATPIPHNGVRQPRVRRV